ncbi:MAG: phosphatidate cytidylyltransferase [bacterium]|nr:phosphatidate cytidylyltransferase [bacterium]
MSNLVLRISAAMVGIPILLWCAISGGIWIVVLVCALQLLLLQEWRGFTKSGGIPLWSPAVAVAVAGIDIFVFRHGDGASTGESLIGVYIWVLVVVFSRERKPLIQLGYGALFLIYAALPLALWFPITEFTDITRHSKLGALGLLFAATWLCDSTAYFGGRTFGRHKLYLQASPNKTIEGAISGFAGATLLLPALKSLNLATPCALDYVFLPLIVGVAGQIGDLIESLMKREAGVKDSSQVIPGHGGFLDRFDSLLLSSPLYLAFLALTTN